MHSLDCPYDITMADKVHFQNAWNLIKTQKLGKSENIKNGMQFTKRVLRITTSACIDQSKR